MITRLVPAVLALSLAFPAVAAAQPLPGFPDYPEVDETAAHNYGITHQRELCSIMEYRIAQANPAVHPIDSMITEVAQRGQFNHDSAGFALGVALGRPARSSCRTSSRRPASISMMSRSKSLRVRAESSSDHQ